VILAGHEEKHSDLRNSVAEHLRNNCDTIFERVGIPVINKDLSSTCADALHQSGSWVGEDGILATADYLKREIHVYTATLKEFPLVYTPVSKRESNVATPLLLAFFEPGHYCAIINSITQPVN
jgi:hypothetical protein